MSTIKEKVNKKELPKHIAVIMDGNGRWAKREGEQRVFGHKAGVKSVQKITEAAAELGIEYLTLYAFSTENWKRPAFEVSALMKLLVNTIADQTETLVKNKIRLRHIGDAEKLPKACRLALSQAIKTTENNTGLNLVMALNYSSKWEITEAVKKIACKVEKGQLSSKEIDTKLIERYLETNNIPDPELIIRTSGEYRVSNFLLWQSAYSEFYFTDKLWPDFEEDDFYEAIYEFQNRERRFGLTGEQIQKTEK